MKAKNIKGYIDNLFTKLTKIQSLSKIISENYLRDLRFFGCCHRMGSIHFRRQISLWKIGLVSFCRVKYFFITVNINNAISLKIKNTLYDK